MHYIPAKLRHLVIQRAVNRCEYCKLSQIGQAATFHIDHVTPVVAGGETTSSNLALACVSCSPRKSARQTVVAPKTEAEVLIFNPRLQQWSNHFYWDEVYIIGRTPTGRATIKALDLNRSIMVAIRTEEAFFHRHLPDLSE